MSYFLLRFRRGPHEPPVLERFEDAAVAMSAFTAAERRHRDDNDGYGVVLLIAEDEETLRSTHTHYFVSYQEMLGNLSPSSA